MGVFFHPTPSRAASLRAVSLPWLPWNIGEGGAVEGIAARIARHILERAGLSPHMSILPWPRCHAEAKEGSTDLIWCITRTAERATYLTYSQPIWCSSNLIFFHRDDNLAPWRSWDALSGKTLGMVRGYNYGLDLESLRLRGVRFELVGGDDALPQMLASRRIDAFVMEWQAYRLHVHLGGGAIAAAAPSGLSIPDLDYYVAASKRSPLGCAVLPRIDKAIAAVRADGSLKQLLQHGIDPAAPPGAPPTHVAPA